MLPLDILIKAIKMEQACGPGRDPGPYDHLYHDRNAATMPEDGSAAQGGVDAPKPDDASP